MEWRGLTYAEAADYFEQLSWCTADPDKLDLYRAAVAWARVAALWGPVDLDRTAAHQGQSDG